MRSLGASWPPASPERRRPPLVFPLLLLVALAISRASAAVTPDNARQPQPPGKPLFEDVSDRLDHRHTEEPFDDFVRQPLLPRKLSQLGPGVAWIDLDGDGRDDLVIGTGKGGTPGVFRNVGGGRFESWATSAGTPGTALRDWLGLATIPGTNGIPRLLATTASYEGGSANDPAVISWAPGSAVTELASADASSTGPLALADVDGDGDLDMFLGGRCVPGRWPEPASSRILRNNRGRLEVDTNASLVFKEVGLVTGAVFTDLDGDGDPDLALALEYGPIRIFRNDRGHFRDATVEMGMASFTGWWNGIAAADFDEDGRMDLIAGNWGLNSTEEGQGAIEVWSGDFDRNGTWDVIESRLDPGGGGSHPLRPRSVLEAALPSLAEKFPGTADYNRATVAELLAEAAVSARRLSSTWRASSVFLNRGSRFEARALPIEAQWAPAFGVVAADFDGNGHLDVFLAHDEFDLQRVAPRQEASHGLLLLGDGRGAFQSMSAAGSGIQTWGAGRGAAAADFDGDGRMDLCVGQNGGRTRLFHNCTARPGVQIRLSGEPENSLAIGAQVRWAGENHGPTMEIHSGGGYLSQDAAGIILSRREGTNVMEVRWPGLAEWRRYEVPPAVTEFRVTVPMSGP